MTGPRLIARIALFSALIYVLSWGMVWLPNVNVAFFVAFLAGLLWGLVPGLLVGGIGMWLWTTFNPFGPADLPVMVAQIGGMAACGGMGRAFRSFAVGEKRRRLTGVMITAAAICTILFYVPVSLVDAWVYRPFWPRLIGGLAWSLFSLAANLVIFPLLFTASRPLLAREAQWR